MQLVSVLLLIALYSHQVLGYLITIPKYVTHQKPPTSDWVHKQKLILWLFEDICEDSVNPTIVRLANEFSLESAGNSYDNPDIVANLQNSINNNRITSKDVIFYELNNDHIEELKYIYDLLYNAKGFDAFYNAAAWARQNTNCGIFVDAMYASIFHRRDTEKIALPPPYELFPNYFILRDFITKGVLLLNNNEDIVSDDIHIEGNVCTIDANYTGELIENEDESILSYFLEDIGLNSYYYFNKLKQNEWTNDVNDNSGEYWYHLIKQLVARYNLERYSNGFPEVTEFSLNDIPVKYDSKLMYSNGYDIPPSSIPDEIENSQEYMNLKSIESNISLIVNDLVTRGFNKSKILSELMEILVFRIDSYESSILKLLSSNTEYKMPTVLEHYMTMLRDPIYWKILKKITNMVENSFSNLPAYKRNELYFPGIKVSDVFIKKITTNFDSFDFDVTNAIKSNSSRNDIQIKISQPRLGNKPFTLKINITSAVTKKGMIKIYIGSKSSQMNPSVKNLFLLDSFEYAFKIGENIISRNTNQIQTISKDFLSFKTLYDNIEGAEFGLPPMDLDVENYTKFPSRLIVPKGLPGAGGSYQILIFVAPFNKFNKGEVNSPEFNSAVLSPNYPLDLLEDPKVLYYLPNCIFKQVLITHKGIKKEGYKYKGEEGNEWSGKSYEYSNKEQSGSYDYKAKKEKYAKKQNKDEFSNSEKVTTTSSTTLDTKGVYDVLSEEIEEDPLVEQGNNENNLSNNNDSKFMNESNQEENTSFFKRLPRVYDYIFRLPYDLDYDDIDNKVYE